MPKVIYVQEDTSEGGENLLAWRERKHVEEGRAALYVRGDEIDVRRVEEVRRKGLARWEKWR